MKRRLLVSLVAAALALPVLADDTKSPDSADATNLPAQELTPRILYEFLLAEIAGSAGQIDVSLTAYADLARLTRDPRIISRATEVALFAKRYDAALELAQLWREVAPESGRAVQLVTGLQAMNGNADALQANLTTQLHAAGNNVGALLMQVNRMVARLSDKAAALALIDKVTEPYVGIAEAHFARAQAAHGAGDLDRSVKELDLALGLRPDWEQAALVRAQMTREPGQATAFLERFIEANPRLQDARLAYARSLVADKRYADARKAFRKLLDEHPDNGDVVYAVAVLSLQLEDTGEAETEFKRLIDMNHAESDRARLYLGQIAEERKQPDGALNWYQEVGLGDQYLPARMRMARIQVRSGNLDLARKTLQDSTAESPQQRAQLLIAEAQILRDAGQQVEAYTVLADGLKKHPDEPDLLYESALQAEKAGKFEFVEPPLRRLIELKPDQAQAYNALGYSLADRNVRLDEAQQLIDKALELSPDDPFILDSKAWVMFRRGDAIGALELLTKAFSLRPDPEIAAHLGEVLWALGRKDDALKTWNDAIKTSPGNEVLVSTIKRFAP